jgi:Tol biopolymer transport system component
VFSRAPTVGAVESLFVVGRDGGNLRALGIQGADASWAPDGRRLAFWQRRPDGVALTVANLGGSAPVAITRSLPAYSGAARWSPDGTRLVFTVCSEFGACRVDVGDASGDAVLILGSGAEPSWSPDGSRVAFSARRICRWSGVFTVRPDGGGLARVTPCR